MEHAWDDLVKVGELTAKDAQTAQSEHWNLDSETISLMKDMTLDQKKRMMEGIKKLAEKIKGE